MSPFAQTPAPPYYAVIFSSQRTDGDAGYGEMADRMVELASRQPGFLGVETTRGADGFGITVSYWRIRGGHRRLEGHAEHRVAQRLGAPAVVHPVRAARRPGRAHHEQAPRTAAAE